MADQGAVSDRLLGRTLDHYRVLERIGAGGMGVVYRARDERLDRDVALKLLPAGVLAEESTRRRFRREALALSKLNHPNITTVFDFHTQEGMDFLVMELVSGRTLSEKLGDGPLPEGEVAALGLQLAEGLAAAHGEGVVHRDLKPGNVRVTPDGRLKILDFGLAKLARPSRTMAGSTPETMTETMGASESQMPVGTVPYMAPEQLRGEVVDARSDIWGAGLVLYEMATGRRAYADTSQTRLVASILSGPVPAPRSVRREISAGLESVVLKCLEKDPGSRYQSARELAADLKRLGEPSFLAVPRRERSRWIVAGIAAAALLVAAAALVAFNIGGLRTRWLGAAGEIRSLAILPLQNLSGDPAQEYVSDGLTGELITSLCKIAALRVVSQTSVSGYKGSKKPLRQIAKELGVDAVVEGSAVKSGERIRISARLIRARGERQLWAESYERDVRDILALQGEMARTIAGALRLALTPEEKTRLAGAGQVDPRAYDLYLKGWAKYWGEQQGSSFEDFSRATEIDPNFAGGWAGMSIGLIMNGASSPGQAASRVMSAARKAVELDDNLSDAHAALGYAKMLYEWDWSGAEKEFQRALDLNPNSPAVLDLYRTYLTYAGRAEEAVPIAEAVNRPPTPVKTTLLGYTYRYARRYEDAIRAFNNPILGDVNGEDRPQQRATCYAALGRLKEAKAEMDTAEARGGVGGWWWALIADKVGQRERARAWALAELKGVPEREAKGDYLDPFDSAMCYFVLGDLDRTFMELRKGVQRRSTSMHDLADPLYDPLQSDPRMLEVKRMAGHPDTTRWLASAGRRPRQR